MNILNQISTLLTGMEAVPVPKGQTAPSSEPDKFESVLRDKHQEAADQTGRKDKPQTEPKAEEGTGEPDGKIPEEQYVLAAAMVMQPRPEIVQVETEPETVETETAVELLPEETASQPLAVETQADVPQDSAEPEVRTDFAPLAANESTGTKVPVTEENTAPKNEAEQIQEEEPAEIFQPIEDRDTPELPQNRTETAAKPETGTETGAAKSTQDDFDEDFDIKGAWNEPVFTRTDAMPVKVAAPEKPVDLEAPDAAEQLSDKLLNAAKDGLEQMQIHLSPEGLGELNVTISRLESGGLSIVLRAADPRAAALLQQHTADLQHTMAGAVRGEVEIEVQEPQSSHQQQLLNPDGGQEQGQREQQRRRQDNQKQESDDFMQKLRLGLTDLTRPV